MSSRGPFPTSVDLFLLIFIFDDDSIVEAGIDFSSLTEIMTCIIMMDMGGIYVIKQPYLTAEAFFLRKSQADKVWKLILPPINSQFYI